MAVSRHSGLDMSVPAREENERVSEWEEGE